MVRGTKKRLIGTVLTITDVTSKSMIFLSIDRWCSRGGCMMELRVRTRHTTLYCGILARIVATSPVVNRAAEPRSVKVHCKNIEDSSTKEDDASDQWEGI